MSLEIAWKQNILVKDSNLLKLLLVGLGFGSQTFICGFSRQNICSVALHPLHEKYEIEQKFCEILTLGSQHPLIINVFTTCLSYGTVQTTEY